MTKNEVGSFARSTVSLPIMVPLLLGSFVLLSFTLSRNQAHATPPITPSGLNTQVADPITVNGSTQYDITGGTRPGGGANLFHSFGDFNVPTNNIANFLNAGSVDVNGNVLASNLPTSNILGRVTGGNISNIFGTIQTTGFGTANLFLMNPAGFLFGPSATVNVGGMMTFTTANNMQLTDGGRFNANPNAIPGDLLTTVPVAAFGFLGSNPAAINFEGGQLNLAGGTGLALVGGDINLIPDASGTSSGITAHGRSIQMTSVAGPGEVTADTGVPAAGMALGTITLGQGTILDTSGDSSFGNGSGGAVSIRGGQLVATGATIFTYPIDLGSGGPVTVDVTGSATFTDSLILTGPSSAGSGGALSVTANDDLAFTNTFIVTGQIGVGAGNGGPVTLTTNNGSLSLTDSFIGTTASAPGNGGAVTISGKDVTFTRSGIATDVDNGSFGNFPDPVMSQVLPGAVTITAQNTVTLSGSFAGDPTIPIISTRTFDTPLDAGSVTIASKTVDLSNGSIDATTNASIGDLPRPGTSGTIEIRGNDVNLSQFNLTSNNSYGFASTGKGGNILLRGFDNQLANSIQLTDSQIDVASVTSGGSGNIVFQTQGLTLSNTIVAADAFNAGPAGSITVHGAQSVTLRSNSVMESSALTSLAFPAAPVGPAGTILIETQQLTMQGGSVLKAADAPQSRGNAGSITVRGTNGPAQSILIDGSGTGMFTDAEGNGAGGNINLFANLVTLQNGGTLSATTSGTIPSATGGTIAVNANTVTLTTGGTMTARSIGAGGAGDITVQGLASPAQSVLIDGTGSGIFTDTQGTGAGGNILVNANSVTLQNGGTLSAATSGTASSATGGTITVDASQVQLLTGGLITAATTGPGDAGSVTITAADSVTIEGQVSSVAPPLSEISRIITSTSGSGNGGDVTITAGQSLSITGNQSGIITNTSGTGNAGNITIAADALTLNGVAQVQASALEGSEGRGGNIDVAVRAASLTGGSLIHADTVGQGDAGNIRILGDESIMLSDFSEINNSSSGSDAGNAGQIWLTAPSIVLQNSQLASFSEGLGNAGNILLEAKTVTVGTTSDSGSSTISALTSGPGRGGDITIRGLEGPNSRAGDVTVSGATAVITTTTGDGHAGDIAVRAERFTLSDNGTLFTSTGGKGDAGNISIDASASAQVSFSFLLSSSDGGTGNAGEITITTPTVTVEQFGIISTSTVGTGNAGTITVNANSINILSGAQLTSSSVNLALDFPESFVAPTGHAGNVTIQGLAGPAQSVLVDGAGSGIFTDTQGTGAGGNIMLTANTVTLQNSGTLSAATSGTAPSATGGTITVEANQVQLTNGGLITASTTRAGDGGSITIGAGSTFASNASTVSSTAAQAQGGDINITAGQSVTLSNDSHITAKSEGPGDAGNIFINAGQNYTSTNSEVTTQATALGTNASGGNITVLATDTVQLTNNSQLNASVQGSSTTVGGNITIDPQYVILQNSQIRANATQGQGGAISFIITNGGLFLSDANSTVSASSQFGANGTVTIQNPNAPTGGQIQPLGKTPLLTTSLLNQRCAALASGEFSSFTVAGRDSLPTEPGGWLTSPLALASAGFSASTVTGGRDQTRVVDPANETTVLSLRQIAPAGFLTQAFAGDRSAGCKS